MQDPVSTSSASPAALLKEMILLLGRIISRSKLVGLRSARRRGRVEVVTWSWYKRKDSVPKLTPSYTEDFSESGWY